MKLQQIQNLTAVSTGSSNSGAYKMADLTKKMSPDNPTQILTTHDLSTLRTLQRVINTSNNNNNTALEDSIIYNSINSNNNNINSRLQNYHHNNNNSNHITNGASNHHNNHNNNNNNSSSNNHNGNSGSGGSLVFSTIPLDGHALLIQPTSHHLLQATNAATSTLGSNGLQQVAQQQARALVTSVAAATATTNGLRVVNSSNNNNNNINHITNNTVTSSIGPAGVTNYISSSGCGGNSGYQNNNNNNISANNNNSLNSFLAKATILSAANLSNTKASAGKIFTTGSAANFLGSNNNNNNNTSLNSIGSSSMPTTSKYVLLQPNGNGKFTTYEGATPAAAAAAAAANGHNTGAPSVGNIVLLATEPMDLNGSGTTLAGGGDAAAVGRIITTGGTGKGENDDVELRPLAWLNDSNLIKGIVTTTAGGAAGGANVVKRVGTMANGNICILNASNAHELIEELPHHVVGSEEVTTTTSPNSGNVSATNAANGGGNNTTQHDLKPSSGTQITPLSVSDFQQLKRFGNIITAGTPITLLPATHDTTPGATNVTGGGGRKSDDSTAHIFGNIGAISATTTVHMGPSGTTTVVEYKSNGNMPTLQPRQLLSAAAATSVGGGATSNGATTITPTNLSTNVGNNNNNNNNNNTIINSSNNNYVPSSISSSSTATSTLNAQSINASNASIMAAVNPPASSISVSYTMTTSSSSLSTSGGGAAAVHTLPKQFTTLPSGVVTVTNGNSAINTIYQGQQQQQKQQHINNGSNNNNSNINITTSTTSTTHHPHKKYLREKMNVLDHGGGSGGNGTGGSGAGLLGNTLNAVGNASTAAVTVVASPASSSSSFSSSLSLSSSSSSTAAVNGGNSPISKSFYAAGVVANNSHNNNSNNNNSNNNASGNNSNNNNNNSGAINYSSTANASPSIMSGNNNNTSAGPNGNITVGSPTTTGGIPTYTIMQYQSVASSPGISSPEPNNSKEFYPLIAPQQQLQQQQRNSMRSPTSYSSYDNDSLKDFEISTNGSSGLSRHNTSTPQHLTSHQSAHQLSSSGASSASSKNSHSAGGGGSGMHSGGGGGAAVNGALTPQKQKHPNNVPYDPFVHTHNKPPYSFSSLIFMAIEGSNEKALPVKEIYAWIMQHFPYFKTAPAGWKNSVRHNLSLNKSFVKVEKAPNMGKGSLWRVEPQQRQNLIQALNRSPFFPNSAAEKSAASLKSPGGSSAGGLANDSLIGYDTVDSVGSGGGGACSPAPKTNINPRIDPRLFPKLSKVIGGQGLLNDVVVTGDLPDEDTPSDYSTTNHNNNMNNSSNNNNNNNNKYGNYSSAQLQNQNSGLGSSNGGNAGSGGNSGATILGHFSNYESMERLARDCGADSIDDVNAATAMLALKHGPKVFAETFQNGAPVITSSPSEDHTYSAGGAGNSGGSTPNATNGSAAPAKTANGTTQQQQQQQNDSQNGDNQSNYTSSDAAYESSEDNNNITPEELEDQRRQREGVDALLSLSRSSVVESPTKRPSSTSVEEEHISACLESNKTNNNDNNNHNHNHFINGNAKMSLLTSAVAYSQQQQQHHHVYDDSGNGFHTPTSYYGATQAHQMHHHLSGLGSAQRKIKPLRSLRTKIKRKAPWMSKAR